VVLALVTYSDNDPVWFFNNRAGGTTENFAGPFGAFVATLSFQMAGYATYFGPFIVGFAGWHTSGARRSTRPTRSSPARSVLVTCLVAC
jgi:hypothetical protein